MEVIQFSPMILTIISILLSFSIIFKLKSKTRSNLPPGPRKLPLIGNIHNLVGALPHRALHELSLKYGPLMHLQLGEVSTVVISSPSTARQVMKTLDINFATRPPISALDVMSYGCTSITFGPYSDYWRQIKKISTLELLSAKRVKSFRAIREDVFSDLVRWLSRNEGLVVSLSEKFYSSAYTVTSRAALGKKNDEEERILLAVLKELILVASGFDIADLYPSMKLVLQMISGLRRKVMRLHGKTDRMFDGIIREHRAALSGDREKDDDILDVLLKWAEPPLTDANIKAVLMDVLGAGSETSGTTMDWAMAEMLNNPRVLQKAQDEVRKVFDDKGYVDESKIHQLKYLNLVIKETLRMHPPLPLLLPRKCRQTCQVDGYEIKADTRVVINAWAINRNPNSWKDSQCFEPERFLDSVVDYKGTYFEYIPFGAGRRICPGMAFGVANVELPLAMLLYHFDWHLPSDQSATVDLTEAFGVTARKAKSLNVIPVIKRSLPTK